jgi:hypothetical protein
MKKIILLILLLPQVCQNAEEEKIKLFSNQLKELISKSDKISLKNLRVYPEKDFITSESVTYLTNDNDSFNLSNLMSHKFLEVLVKKDKNSDKVGCQKYRVIFYNSKKLQPNNEGFFDIDDFDLIELWGIDYVATELIVINGEVMFYLTPFFFETDFFN